MTKNKFTEVEAEKAPELTNEQAGSEEESEEEAQPAVRNRFDLLLEGDDDGADDVQDENSDASEETSPVVKAPEKVSKPQKKRNRKKKRKNAAKTAKENDADWEALLGAPILEDADGEKEEPMSIDEDCFRTTDGEKFRTEANEIFNSIKAIVAEQRAEEAELNASFGDQVAALTSSLRVMSVEPRLLSADAELKKRFGYKAVEAERRAEEQEQANRGGRRGRGRNRAAPRSHLRRKITLVTPRDEWWSEADGLNMVVDHEAPATGNGIRYFRYTHGGTYEAIQKDYRRVVASHDVNSLAELAAHYPFHVDALIQLAEVHRQMGELDRAADQIERAIYVLESSWNMAFKPFQGDCRLRFAVPENKAIYVALFRYAQLLTRRGLHRTALEIAKLVLNFDPENDPMGALMLIDSVALLSGQYEWICAMQRDFKLIPLKYFPNFALSNALAVYHLQNGTGTAESELPKKKKKKGKRNSGAKEGTDIAATIASESPPAVDLLAEALLAFPIALQPLLAATKDSGGSWSSHPIFSTHENAGGVFYRISRVYAERSHTLWAAGEPKALLASAAQKAIELAGTPRALRAATALQLDAMQWFESTGLYRSVQIADFADGGVNLPAELLAADNAPINQPAPRAVTTAEAMREFMQSLLPWRNTGDAANDVANRAEDNAVMEANLQNLLQARINDDEEEEHMANVERILREGAARIRAAVNADSEEEEGDANVD